MSRRLFYALLGIVAAAGLWFVADAPRAWERMQRQRTPFRGPIGPMAADVARNQAEWVPCSPLTPEQQEELSYNGNRPVETCRIEAADTVTVLLRGADSTVISLVRVWQPGPARLEASYAAMAAELDRRWGESVACPENEQRGAQGDRVWTRDDSHVRLYKQLPDRLVVDYELGRGSCQMAL